MRSCRCGWTDGDRPLLTVVYTCHDVRRDTGLRRPLKPGERGAVPILVRLLRWRPAACALHHLCILPAAPRMLQHRVRMPARKVRDGTECDASRPYLGMPPRHEKRHVPSARSADDVHTACVDLHMLLGVVDCVHYVLDSQIAAARGRSLVRAPEVWAYHRPSVLLRPREGRDVVGLKPVVGTPRVQSDDERHGLGLRLLRRPWGKPYGVRAASRPPICRAPWKGRRDIRRAAVRGLGTFTWGFLRHSPASVLARGKNRRDARIVSVGEAVLEHLGLDLWKCVIFRRLVCLLLFIC